MDNSQNSIKAFTDAIKRMAKEECDAINNETRQIKSQRLDALIQQTRDKYNNYVDYELLRLQADTNRQISILHENEKKELAALRSKLTDKIFDAVLTELSNFTNTTEYKKLMIRSFAEIIEALPDEELEFFVRQEDMILCDEICKALDRTLEIKPADDIKLGGVKAVGIKTESLADDTLDTKLEEQKKLFVEHSGFKI
ncbi:MAG TPA: hypothetical protein DCR23_02535 [Ruminococcaceae bacterium]|nr:hypothetical protein [Oscillospiraceae bacterium]